MKNSLLFWFGAFLVAGSLLMTSCTKDDTMDPDPTVPTLSLGTGAGFVSADVTIEQGTTFKVNLIAAKGSGNLSEVTVFKDNVPEPAANLTVDGSAATANPIAVGAFDANALNWEVEVLAADHPTTHTYRFMVQGADGLTASVQFNVTTVDPGTPVQTQMGVIFNASGPNLGGFDLKTGTSVTEDSPNADIRDRGIDLGQPVATNWRRQIEPRNGAVLRKAAAGVSFDATTTKEQVQAAFDGAGGNLANSPVIANGDIYLVQQGAQYFMVRFTKVNMTAADNLDTYEIDIKK